MLAAQNPSSSPAADPCEHLSRHEAAALAQKTPSDRYFKPPLAQPQLLPPYVYDKSDDPYLSMQPIAGRVPAQMPDDCNDPYMRQVMPQRDRRTRFRRIFEEYMT